MPLRAYVVCATPRSGSTLLCEMLRQTGRAGRPLEHFEILRHSSLPRQPREYLQDLNRPGLLELLAPTRRGTPSREPAQRWWRRILAEGSTDNGVWGGKLMWGHVGDLVSRARELPGMANADLDAVLHTLLDDPQLVLVTRGDKIAQAVSLWRALQTQSWRTGEVPRARSLVYDFAAIDHLATQLQSDELAWRRWLARVGRRPIEVTYDQLDTAPEWAAARVLEALGLTDVAVSAPPLSRQRDELSSIWVKRHRRERERAA
jgi:trehalose 2-sulfotransferase